MAKQVQWAFSYLLLLEFSGCHASFFQLCTEITCSGLYYFNAVPSSRGFERMPQFAAPTAWVVCPCKQHRGTQEGGGQAKHKLQDGKGQGRWCWENPLGSCCYECWRVAMPDSLLRSCLQLAGFAFFKEVKFCMLFVNKWSCAKNTHFSYRYSSYQKIATESWILAQHWAWNTKRSTNSNTQGLLDSLQASCKTNFFSSLPPAWGTHCL